MGPDGGNARDACGNRPAEAGGAAVTLPLGRTSHCDYVLKVEAEHPSRQIAVIVPELVERHWYHYPLHNKRAEILKWFILLKGNERIVLINVPWYTKA